VEQVSVTAHDLERATTFYRQVLELKHLFTAGKMSFFDCGGLRLMLAVPDRVEMDHPSSVLYLRVDNLEEAVTRLRERGVEFKGEPVCAARMPASELWLAFFEDSEGNTLSLLTEKPLAK